MQKSVQIDSELFIQIYKYFESCRDNSSQTSEIYSQLDYKLNKLISRELFSKYKRAATAEEREQARQQYLDHVGMLNSFRTSHEVHKNEL